LCPCLLCLRNILYHSCVFSSKSWFDHKIVAHAYMAECCPCLILIMFQNAFNVGRLTV
jgi:hypothetical protein